MGWHQLVVLAGQVQVILRVEAVAEVGLQQEQELELEAVVLAVAELQELV